MLNLLYIQQLQRRQAREGWSTRRMAREIGVGTTTWHSIMAGDREPSWHFLELAHKRFPEYGPYVLLSLGADVPEEHQHGSDQGDAAAE